MTEMPKFGYFGTHVREMVTFGNDGLGCKMAIRKKMVFWAKMCVIWRFCPYKRDIWLFWEGIKIAKKIEKYELCLKLLETGAQTVGVNAINSGNLKQKIDDDEF